MWICCITNIHRYFKEKLFLNPLAFSVINKTLFSHYCLFNLCYWIRLFRHFRSDEHLSISVFSPLVTVCQPRDCRFSFAPSSASLPLLFQPRRTSVLSLSIVRLTPDWCLKRTTTRIIERKNILAKSIFPMCIHIHG